MVIHKTALNSTKHLQVAGYRILKKSPIFEFYTDCLTALLTTVASLEAKQNSARPPFYATITNSPVGCGAFWGSDECVPYVPCLFFFLQSGCLSSSSNETISRH